MAGKRKDFVYGVGVNDADYIVSRYVVDSNGKNKQILCPYYAKWRSMLERCYSKPAIKKRPKYGDCSACEEWLRFSNFKAWMETQDWEGKHLDKDILVYDNKVYGPKLCIFVDPRINTLLNPAKRKSKLPIGVCFNRKMKKYTAQVQDINSKVLYLGQFDDPLEAAKAYYEKKTEIACALSENEVLTKALIGRITKIRDEFIEEYYARSEE